MLNDNALNDTYRARGSIIATEEASGNLELLSRSG